MHTDQLIFRTESADHASLGLMLVEEFLANIQFHVPFPSTFHSTLFSIPFHIPTGGGTGGQGGTKTLTFVCGGVGAAKVMSQCLHVQQQYRIFSNINRPSNGSSTSFSKRPMDILFANSNRFLIQ